MIEVLTRERWNKIAEWELSLTAIALFLGTPGDSAMAATSVLRKEMTDRIFHRIYEAPHLMWQLQRRLDATKKDLDLLKRLEEMTVQE